MRNRCHHGFTLIEALAVIAIIAILATLLFATFSQVKAKAQRIYCVNNLRQLGLVMQQFVLDNHAYPLSVNPNFRKGSYPDYWSTWHMALQHNGLMLSENPTNHLNATEWLREGVWKCPSARVPASFPTNQIYFSYGYNAYGLSAQTDSNSLGLGGHNVWIPRARLLPPPPIDESEVANPADMMAIGDGYMGNDGILRDGVFTLWRVSGMTDYLGSTIRSTSRHQGRANVFFCDGHVESPTLKFLFEDSTDAALARWNRDHLPHREKL